ncbi:MAG TPA: GNAT family N-acetyltransferase [Polyangiaceae bacterium]|nr:GNAT family N-acetyltransferase [Polyangiaceae bacterium]
MKPIFRRLRREEVPLAADVFLVSLAELARAHGLPPPVSYTRAAVVPAYEHLFETGIFEVAELDGKIVGIAAATVRDSIWFLAMFWVLPEHKLQGIGRPLLERVERLGAEQGATVRCVWSSIDFAAIASYLKLDMMPAGPIFTFTGPLASEPAAHDEARVSELDPKTTSAIDRIVRGVAREQDHAYFRARATPAYQLEIEQRAVGYFYVKDGVIGPAAWSDSASGEALLSHALRQASSQAPEVKMIALGVNQTAIRHALGAGLKLVSASHFFTSRAFGKLDCYLPSGPVLF